VQVLDQLIVRLGVGDVGVHPDIGHKVVDRHPGASSSWELPVNLLAIVQTVDGLVFTRSG
jgi:hypothetical protein